jgi:hypothetical protein
MIVSQLCLTAILVAFTISLIHIEAAVAAELISRLAKDAPFAVWLATLFVSVTTCALIYTKVHRLCAEQVRSRSRKTPR